MRKHLLITVALLSLCGCGSPPVPTPDSTQRPVTPSPTPSTPRPPAEAARFRIDKNRREDVPVRLTASDGTGLELASYKAKAVVNGPLAFTELHLVFNNPQDRVLEGHFEIVLPEGAALSRLAMKNEQGWQEAEVVELQKARQAYEDALHHRQDPALIEKQAGNQFQARVFPIPARGQKELILSYSQELTSEQNYVLPLGGLPKVAELALEATVWVGPDRPEQTLTYTLQQEAPSGDLAILRSSPIKGLVNGDLTLLSVTPQAKAEAIALEDMLVLVDTSASRAAGYRAQLDKLQQTLQALAQSQPGIKIKIAAFDQEVVPLYEGPIKNCQGAFNQLAARRPLGATDLVAALAWADHQKGYKRLLVVTDGVATAGAAPRAGDDTAAEGNLPSVKSVGRIDALLVGGIRDTQGLQDLVYHQEAYSGLLLDGDKSASELARSLLLRPASGIKVAVAGADWVWPDMLDGVEPAQERLVYAHFPAAKQDVQVSLSGPAVQQELKIPLTSVNWPLLERAAAAAHLGRLNQERLKAKDKEREALAQQMVELSCKYRVVCDLTALLVLETDADYARFGIDRKSLSDILVVGKDGIELKHREQPVMVTQQQDIPMKKSVTIHHALSRQEAADKDEPPSGEAMKTVRGAPGSGYMNHDNPVGSVAGRSGAPDASTPNYSQRQGLLGGSGEPGFEDQASAGGTAPSALPPPMAQAAAPTSEMSRARMQEAPGEVSDVARRPSVSRPMPMARRLPGRGNIQPNPQPIEDGDQVNEEAGAPALSGELLEIDRQVKAGHAKTALARAQKWQSKEPGDVLALVALGESYEALGDKKEAARAYGSIIDLYPGRADLRRFAGSRLEVIGLSAESLAADTFAKALEQRPDHPSSYRMRAYALVRLGHLAEAFDVLEKGAKQPYPAGRFLGCDQILREDLGLVGAAWAAREPKLRPEILKRLEIAGSNIEAAPSTRFVLSWETDANDVDFHIRDSHGGHAYYGSPGLRSGGRLYADVTTGYGPECFNIPGKPQAGPYKIFIHYYSRGPMGYGMGKVEIVRHDGNGHLRFEERPYVVMNDQAYVDLGMVKI